MENWDSNAIYIFRFRMTLKNRFEFCFLFFVFASLWKTDNKVAEHSFGSLWVYNICKIMAKEPFIRAYKEFLSWVPFHLSLEHMFCATYRRSWTRRVLFFRFQVDQLFYNLWCSKCVYLSANRFSMAWENGIQMPFTFFVFAWHWKTDFVFRFRFTLKNGYEFQFSFFVFASLWKTDLNFVFRFCITCYWKTDWSFVCHEFEKWINTPVIWNSPPPPQGDDRDNEGPFTS